MNYCEVDVVVVMVVVVVVSVSIIVVVVIVELIRCIVSDGGFMPDRSFMILVMGALCLTGPNMTLVMGALCPGGTTSMLSCLSCCCRCG
jgi:hypothetical protein